MMEALISAINLSKRYRKLMAVDQVTIEVTKGEIYGFLGLNGAGKTTTIRMLLGLIKPTSGNAFLDGKIVNPGNSDMWKNVGHLVEVPYSYPDLTVRENLEIFRRLRLIKERKSVDNIIDKLKLGQYTEVVAGKLSLGNLQRLGLAKALMHNPDIIILDEPANGLDPAGIVEIRELLLEMAHERGAAIFISSHILGEISKFASRLGIIHEGKILYESSVRNMEQQREKCLKVKTHDLTATKALLNYNGYDSVISAEGIMEVTDLKAIEYPEKVAELLVNNGFPPGMIKVEEEDLEKFFLRIIQMKGQIS